MSKLVLVLIIGVSLIATGSEAFGGLDGPTPAQVIARQKQTIRDLRLDKADLRDEIDAQDKVLSDQADTIQRLRARLASQSDPLDAITTRNPDGLWAAMVAIFDVFPTNGPGALCGYDKSNVPGTPPGLTLTSYSFYRWTGC